MIIESLEQFKQEGLSIIEEPTMLNDPLYIFNRARIQAFIDQSPEMSKRPPWEYQIRNSAVAACRPRNLLAHEQGLGKTYETIMIILARYGDILLGKGHKTPKRNTITILAPRHTLNHVWKHEFETCGLGHLVDIILDENDVRMARKPIWLMDVNNFLKNQSSRGKELETLGKQRTRINRYEEVEHYSLGWPMWKLVRQLAFPHMVVIDEIHNLRGESDRTESITQYVRGVKNRLGLTGTPADGWVHHLASEIKVVYGEENLEFPWTAKSFSKRFTRTRVVDMDYVTGDSGSEATRRPAPGINPDQIPEFHKAIRHLVHRQVYRDPEVSAHVKFPPVKHELVLCDMDPEHAEYYHGLSQHVIKLIEEALKQIDGGTTNIFRQKQNVLTHLKLLQTAECAPWSIDPEIYKPFPERPINKMEKLLDIAGKAVAEGRKVIVFTNRKAVGRPLTEMFRNNGFGVLRIYSEDETDRPRNLKQEQREDRIESFLADDDKQVIVANLELVSTGLTLTQASVIAHYDYDWKSNPYKQGNSRIIRPGQVWPYVNIWDLVTQGTVSKYIYYAMINKVRANSEMIDRQFNLEGTDPIDLDPVAIGRALLAKR